jgi:predicted transcriptional regulator
MPANTYLISVRQTWASAFFLSHNPKTIELRKVSFGASLKPGDRVAIYATMPTAEVLGIVQVVKRESMPIKQLWQASEQGKLARISEAQFNAYYAQQESGVGVWVDSAELLPKPISLHKLRKFWGANWNPPQQIIKLTSEQMATIDPHPNQPSLTMSQMNLALLCCR